MDLLVVDDHPPVRDGFALLLRKLDDQVSVDQAGNCAEACALAGRRRYDLILLDMKMPGANGLDALAAVRGAFPEALVVIVSGEDADRHVVEEAIERGAVGFIPKSSGTEVMINALKLVLAKGQYIPPTLLAKVPADAKGLTAQQLEVVRRVARGMQDKEIAREMDIAPDTVKMHLKEVRRRLNARNRAAIVYFAAKVGMKLV
jgi:DNA-binding NarL/FixJ family response regulator